MTRPHTRPAAQDRNSQLLAEIERLRSKQAETDRALREALDQQAATAEVLRLISTSPTDLPRVLEAIIESAARLVDASSASIQRIEGDHLVVEANSTSPANPGEGVPLPAGLRRLVTRSFAGGRAVLEKRSIHNQDLAALKPEDGYDPEWARMLQGMGWRSSLCSPLLREGEAIGVLAAGRSTPEGGPQPFSDQQVAFMESFADQAVIAIENARLFQDLQQRDERRRIELERASAIQQRLLPSHIEGWPGILDIAHRFRPAVETSGDFYDVLPLTPARAGQLPPLQIAVGDVAGKGMSAALVTALARSALRSSTSIPPQLASPAGVLRLAGARLHDDVGSQHFVACALAVVEPPGLHNAGPFLRLANAAQVPVLLVRNGLSEEIQPPGYRLPLGAQPDGVYKDAEVELRAGDVVVFSSDGLVEAPSRAQAAVGGHLDGPGKPGELFGFERLASCVAHWSGAVATAEAVAAGIWSDLTDWCGAESHHDDMTLLVLRVP